MPHEAEPTQAVAPREQSGMMALATMTEGEFEERLLALKTGQERIRIIQRELMKDDEDYGVIPGTKKPTLLKPGAEKLCNIYGLVPTYSDEWIEGDGETRPHLRVRMKCYLRKGTDQGLLVAVGVGAANSWETKHRYRGGKRSCPACGVEGSIRRSRFEEKKTGEKGWYCHDKAGGCGENFIKDDPGIVEQQVGLVENKDPYDIENTLFKMAKKRSFIDATLNATATSGLFTQDLEDDAGGDDPPPKRKGNGDRTAAPREPGEDDEPIPSQGVRSKDDKGPRIPKAGPALTDPVALGEELLRLTGDRGAAADLLEQLVGKRSVRGMAGGEVMEAWTKLSQHPTFGAGAGK